MNLYNLHDSPKDLHNHDKADMHVPEVIWDKYHSNKEELAKYEDILATDPKTAFSYAAWILNKPWPKAEKIIGESKYAFSYWEIVLRGHKHASSAVPFPEGEDSIANNKSHAVRYTQVTRRGIPAFEKKISSDPKVVKAYIETFPFRKEAMEKYLNESLQFTR